MKYINYAKESNKVVLPRYREPKTPAKSTGFVRPLGDSKIKVTTKKKVEVKPVEEFENEL